MKLLPFVNRKVTKVTIIAIIFHSGNNSGLSKSQNPTGVALVFKGYNFGSMANSKAMRQNHRVIQKRIQLPVTSTVLVVWLTLGKILEICLPVWAQSLLLKGCQIYESPKSSNLTGLAMPITEVPRRLGTNKVLFIRMRFADEAKDPASLAEAEADLADANTLFQSVSYGRFRLSYVVTPVLQSANARQFYEVGGNEGFQRVIDDGRALAKAAGYDYRQFDLEVVRHTPLSDRLGGEANLGFRGARISAPGGVVIVHELGHNLGLAHARFWSTKSPSMGPVVSPPFPSNARGGKDQDFDPDSLIGHESIIGAGQEEDYGDMFDIMGSGTEQFNTVYKYELGWLKTAEIHEVTSNGWYRIHAFNGGDLNAGCRYGLKVLPVPSRRAVQPHQYWVQVRSDKDNLSFQNGVQVHWGDAGNQPLKSSSLLLDMTPGTPGERLDSALAIGRTFSDELAGLHLTPVVQGEDENGKWVDVAVYFTGVETNQSPTLSVTASQLQVDVNTPVTFRAAASAPGAGALAYHWDFGDLTTAGGASETAKTWRRAGEFVVRCEVSDLRGGKASRNLVVRIGSPVTGRITGRVTDSDGRPISGVRVHNGRAYGLPDSGPYVWGLSDSLGEYVLAGLPPGSYTNNAFLFGYKTVPAGFTPPLTIDEAAAVQADFVLTPLPRVSVSVDQIISEADPDLHQFIFTRTGPTNEPLKVSFSLSGTAIPGVDFAGYFVPSVTIPAGARSTSLPLAIFNDKKQEEAETVTLTLGLPTTSKRQAGTPNEYSVYYPGWERTVVAGREVWAQTQPEYIFGADGITTATIEDDDTPPTLSLKSLANGSIQIRLQGQPGQLHVLEESVNLRDWSGIRTNMVQDGTWIIDDLRISPGQKFFRGWRP